RARSASAGFPQTSVVISAARAPRLTFSILPNRKIVHYRCNPYTRWSHAKARKSRDVQGRTPNAGRPADQAGRQGTQFFLPQRTGRSEPGQDTREGADV